VAQKPQGPDGLPAVPVVPPILAVRKKQRWWVSLLKLLAGTAGTAALVGAVAFAAGQVRAQVLVASSEMVAVQARHCEMSTRRSRMQHWVQGLSCGSM
jgi:hypothetical protein